MAENRQRAKREDLTAILTKKPLPTFKISRDAYIQMARVERTLFTDMQEQQSGNYIISGLTKQISELDFTAFTFAVGQILYNQSYQSGNADVNSGIHRKITNSLSKKVGTNLHYGDIVTSLYELCRLAYGGEPTTELKKKMATVIDTIHSTPVTITFPNGDKVESKLCVTMDKYTREKDGAVIYNLYLNPIFGSRIQNQFGELPQGVISDLDAACKKKRQRKQAAHYLLLRWLSHQDKRYPHTLTIDAIIQELRMEEYFKNTRGKADKQLLSICSIMVDIGILKSYDVEYSCGGKKRITKITFHLNQNYIRQPKETKKKKPEDEA